MIKLLIADDHTIVRKGLKQLIQTAKDMSVVDEASSASEAIDKIRQSRYDVIVTDITMPGMNGLDLLKILRKEKPDLPVLVLSMHPEEQYAVRCFKSGAAGYLTKDSAPNELIDAIRKANKGGKYVSVALAEKLALALDMDTDKMPHETLSDREFQVLKLIASGKTIKDIADEMNLSSKTVSTYRTRILEKTRMNSNSELTHYAIKNDLVI